MGNWRTVQIVGTCGANDADKLRNAIKYILDGGDSGEASDGPLASYDGPPSLCGINDWPAESMSIVGNLSERDYHVNDVADHLRKLVKIAPSLQVEIHCGGDYESLDCVATVTAKRGKVRVCKPKIERLPKISEDMMMGRFLQAITR